MSLLGALASSWCLARVGPEGGKTPTMKGNSCRKRTRSKVVGSNLGAGRVFSFVKTSHNFSVPHVFHSTVLLFRARTDGTDSRNMGESF